MSSLRLSCISPLLKSQHHLAAAHTSGSKESSSCIPQIGPRNGLPGIHLKNKNVLSQLFELCCQFDILTEILQPQDKNGCGEAGFQCHPDSLLLLG